MKKWLNILKNWGKILLALALSALTWLFFKKNKSHGAESFKIKSEAKKNETKERLQKANPSDLVNDSDNSDELHATRKRVKDNARDRVQDRLNEAGL